MKELVAFQGLCCHNLYDTKVTNRGLMVLTQLKDLQAISLDHRQVTEEGVPCRNARRAAGAVCRARRRAWIDRRPIHD